MGNNHASTSPPPRLPLSYHWSWLLLRSRAALTPVRYKHADGQTPEDRPSHATPQLTSRNDSHSSNDKTTPHGSSPRRFKHIAVSARPRDMFPCISLRLPVARFQTVTTSWKRVRLKGLRCPRCRNSGSLTLTCIGRLSTT